MMPCKNLKILVVKKILGFTLLTLDVILYLINNAEGLIILGVTVLHKQK